MDDFRLPEHLVLSAAVEKARNGAISVDTAAALIEAGADMYRLEAHIEREAEIIIREMEDAQ